MNFTFAESQAEGPAPLLERGVEQTSIDQRMGEGRMLEHIQENGLRSGFKTLYMRKNSGLQADLEVGPILTTHRRAQAFF
jgi:hypothetical protein